MDQHPAIPKGHAQGRVPVVMGGTAGHPGAWARGAHALEAGQEKVNAILYRKWCGMMILIHE
jgi:tRNA A37 N6-isopentenylltransferase MiaA